MRKVTSTDSLPAAERKKNKLKELKDDKFFKIVSQL